MCAGLGMGELLVVLAIVIVVFGASKLPQLGDALGRSVRNFKKGINTNDEIDVTPRADKALADPGTAAVTSAKDKVDARQS